jgi:hypothetical protein
LELVKLVQGSNQRHPEKHGPYEFPPSPAQNPREQPGEQASAHGEVQEMRQLIHAGKRWELNVLPRKRGKNPQTYPPQTEENARQDGKKK